MNRYNDEVIKVLKNAEIEAKKTNSSFVGTEHLLLSFIKENSVVKNIFNDNKVYYENIYEKLINEKNNSKNHDVVYYTATLKKIIDSSFVPNKNDGVLEIFLPNLVLSCLDDTSSKAYNLLKNENVDLKELYKDICKLLLVKKQNLLSELGLDLTEYVKREKYEMVIGRDKEINRIVEILARKNKNNPILLGKAGVGKTAIVEELARRINKGDVPNILINKKIVSINLAELISGTKYRGEFEEKMGKIIKELEQNENVILFIDEIHTLVGAGGAEGAIDASNILKPVLARGQARCIGATTLQEYKKTIEKDSALDRRFQKIIIEEPNEEEMKFILNNIKSNYEAYHNVIVPKYILNSIPFLTKKYLTDRNEPDKSIDILDEICAKTSVYSNIKQQIKLKENIKKLEMSKQNKILQNEFNEAINDSIIIKKLEDKLVSLNDSEHKKKVTKKTLKDVLELKCNTDIYELKNNEKEIIKLKKYLKNIIINQDGAVDELVNIYKMYKEKKNLIPTTLLINGKKGTGKRTLINSLASFTKTNIITINMNEFKNELSLNKIVGAPHGYVGYNDNNTLFEELKLNPNSIIIIENFENAHNSIRSLFEDIINNGKIKNSKNEQIFFQNTFIIFIRENYNENNIGFVGYEYEEKNEFYEKIVNKINMNDLDENDIIKIIMKKNNDLKSSEIQDLVAKSSYKKMGASKLEKLLEYTH